MAGDPLLTTLGATADLITGFPFKSELFTENLTDTRLLRGDNVAQGFVRWAGVKRWPKPQEAKDYLLRPGDVIVAMDRPWIEAGLKHATLTEADCPSLLVQRVACLRARAGLDQRFLGYLIRSQAFTDYVLGVQTGTAVPHISANQIRAFQFAMPSLKVQEAASALLGALDDKIELNRRMAETLEVTARALFKSWFVDVDPVCAKAEGRPTGLPAALAALFPNHFGDHRLPEGWEDAPLLSFFELVSGGTPKTSVANYWGGDIPWFSVVDAPASGPYVFTTERRLTVDGLANCAATLLPENATIITARGTVGKLALVGQPMAMNQSCYAAVALDGFGPFFTYFLIQSGLKVLRAQTHGSVFDTITKSTFAGVTAPKPPSQLATAYEAIAAPLMARVKASAEQSRTLAALRDTLLPKLISGELRIRDAERAVAAA